VTNPLKNLALGVIGGALFLALIVVAAVSWINRPKGADTKPLQVHPKDSATISKTISSPGSEEGRSRYTKVFIPVPPSKRNEVPADKAIQPTKGLLLPNGVARKTANTSNRINCVPSSVHEKTSPRKLKAVRLLVTEHEITFRFLADGPIDKYESFLLDAPPRWVIDVKGKWNNCGPPELPVTDRNVKRIRIGEHDDKLRIVLDLNYKEALLPSISKTPSGFIVIMQKSPKEEQRIPR
jgi:hypothetical protein